MSCITIVINERDIGSEKAFCIENGISSNAIQEIKTGRAGLSKMLQNIILQYGVNIDYIMTGKGKAFVKPISEMTIDEKLDYIIKLLRK